MRNRKSFFTTLPVSNDPTSLTAPLVDILRQRGYKKFGVVRVEDPYIDACMQGFRANLRAGESLDVISTVLPGDAEMKPHALRVKSASFDALGVYLFPGQTSSLYRSLGLFQLRPHSFGTDTFESRREITEAGSAIQGALYPNFEIPDWFAKEYDERFHNDAQISYAFTAYAWATIAGSVLSGPSKLSSTQIVDAFRGVKGNEGGLKFLYKETPDGVHLYEFPVIVRTVVDGKFETLKRE